MPILSDSHMHLDIMPSHLREEQDPQTNCTAVASCETEWSSPLHAGRTQVSVQSREQ